MVAFSAIFLGMAAAASAGAVTVSYNPFYDDGAASLETVSCSNGPNGLISRFGWKTLKDVAQFPLLGGASAVAGWGSPDCGTCWELTYEGRSVYVLAVDHVDEGFNLALDALNTLTNGQGIFLGRVEAEAALVDVGLCGVEAPLAEGGVGAEGPEGLGLEPVAAEPEAEAEAEAGAEGEVVEGGEPKAVEGEVAAEEPVAEEPVAEGEVAVEEGEAAAAVEPVAEEAAAVEGEAAAAVEPAAEEAVAAEPAVEEEAAVEGEVAAAVEPEAEAEVAAE